jgi:hypothetical protein
MTESLISLVDKATSEYLVKTDWDVVMQICDTLNRDYNPVGYAFSSKYIIGHLHIAIDFVITFNFRCRDVVRQAAKRMKMKETGVSMYALEVCLIRNITTHPNTTDHEFILTCIIS